MLITITAFLSTLIALSSCTMQMSPDFIKSPSGRYQLKVDLDRDTSNKKKYNCVLLSVCDSSYKGLWSLESRASNTMKWAVGWYPLRDTVILNSKGIGIYAYKVIPTGQLVDIQVNGDIEQQAEMLFNKKYTSDRWCGETIVIYPHQMHVFVDRVLQPNRLVPQ